MDKIYLPIPVPKIIMSLVLWFVLRHRKKLYGYTFRRIKLTKGQLTGTNPAVKRFAIVDPEDYQKLSECDWQYVENTTRSYYAAHIEGGKIVYMHRVIINAPVGSIVDHRYGNGLDNRKVNLRIVTRTQNQYNRRKTAKKTSSKYKGVHFKKVINRYSAEICCNGKRTHLGYFDNEIDAAKAYDKAAKELHGEFARLNFENHEPVPSEIEG
jgi:hypothetical protein